MVIWRQIDQFFFKILPTRGGGYTRLSLLDVIISKLAISANRLARRPPAKTTDGRYEAAPRCFVDEGGVLLS